MRAEKRNPRNFNCLIKLGPSFSGREGKNRQMNKLGCWRGKLNWIKRNLNEFKCSRGSQFHKLTRIDLHQTFPLQNNSGNSIFLVLVFFGVKPTVVSQELCVGAQQYEERQKRITTPASGVISIPTAISQVYLFSIGRIISVLSLAKLKNKQFIVDIMESGAERKFMWKYHCIENCDIKNKLLWGTWTFEWGTNLSGSIVNRRNRKSRKIDKCFEFVASNLQTAWKFVTQSRANFLLRPNFSAIFPLNVPIKREFFIVEAGRQRSTVKVCLIWN